ncbi:hypothetical protein SORBI_3001G072200 [Sorghum bicolor]|uniref:Uncharacterized protein n=2 Tax=Sorghum bicolor TaxID=4558 RepID=A0A1Z5S4N1_SORBI|nr:hypothetical protein SORBI_3001G072200 [Sorghum bicolor]OQU90908.1 hypothetical protein SORBI_3001G072200 [Sorghum bicolor]
MDRSGGGGENGCGQAVPSTLALEGVSRDEGGNRPCCQACESISPKSPLLYGIGILLVMPLKTLYGVGRVFGAEWFLSNMTSVSSSLQIKLVPCLGDI